MATTAYRSTLSRMIKAYGIERTFSTFLNDHEEMHSAAVTYSARRNLVLMFIARVWSVYDEDVAISHSTYHIKGIVGNYPIPQHCIQYRDAVLIKGKDIALCPEIVDDILGTTTAQE